MIYLVDATLWMLVALLAVLAWRRSPAVLKQGSRTGFVDFASLVPRIAIGVIGSGFIAAIIPQAVIVGWIGPQSGWTGVGIASLAGALTPGGPVVGFAIGAAALKGGAGTPQVMAFVIAWALFAVQRLIVFEIPFMPARFVWFRALISLPLPFVAAGLAMWVGSP